jgi:putative transposase
MREYMSNGRAKYLLMAHLIFVVKYRKPLLVRYGNEVKQKMMDIASVSDFDIDTIEVDKDHIHLLISYAPHISISSIVARLKGQTTHDLWKNHPALLKKQFWKEHIFWSPSYFACSVGNASQDIIRHYIENQG